MPETALTSLSHHIDMDWLREAHRLTRKNGAPGIDGQSGGDYSRNLEANLQSLLSRVKTRKAEGYRAPPVRRAYVPKESGEQRPLGLPTYEDKILQRSVAMLLESVYEQSFHDFSYGFRPGRSPHQALVALRQQLTMMGGGWLLEVDIRKFFDAVPHQQIQEIVRKRIQDGIVLRLIGKWLNAGVMEDGRLQHPTAGTPQGGVISPLLANIFLHEVVDEWFVTAVAPRMQGRCFIVRFADDLVIGFENLDDARRVETVLPKRLGKYGLTLHPDKTRLVQFRRPPRRLDRHDGPQGPGTFDFLGFTHYWGRSRTGSWVIKRKTAKSRLKRSIRAAWEWLRSVRHQRIRDQYARLVPKLKGHYQYFGIRGNYAALAQMRRAVERSWQYWLRRRAQVRTMPWAKYSKLLERYPLPQARIVHTNI
jgi:group II intron reverse transcriptase/maturase